MYALMALGISFIVVGYGSLCIIFANLFGVESIAIPIGALCLAIILPFRKIRRNINEKRRI